MRIFDTHAHYLREDFGEELEGVLEGLPSKGVERVIAVGCDLDSVEEELELARKYPFISAAGGIHPENCRDLPEDWESRLEELLKDDNTAALGEIGLDYHYSKDDKELQKEIFEKQLIMAEKLDLPVIIHSREATADTLELLKKYSPRGVVHCFSGSPETAAEIVKLGMYIGFTGLLTFKNAKKAVLSCAEIPMERLLLETDCPYMAPEPLRGKRCDSSMIRYTAAKMAEIKGITDEEAAGICAENAYRLFDRIKKL